MSPPRDRLEVIPFAGMLDCGGKILPEKDRHHLNVRRTVRRARTGALNSPSVRGRQQPQPLTWTLLRRRR